MIQLVLRSFFLRMPKDFTQQLTAHPIEALLFWLYIDSASHYILAGSENANFYLYGLSGFLAYACIILLAALLLEKRLNISSSSLATLFFLQQGAALIYTSSLAIFNPNHEIDSEYVNYFAFLIAFAGHIRVCLHLTRNTQLINRFTNFFILAIAGLIIFKADLLKYTMWYPNAEEMDEEVNGKVEKIQFNPEDVLSLQNLLLKTQLEKITPAHSGDSAPQLYYLGFAPYGSQQVFMREETLARAKIAERFHAENNGLSLVNQPSTVFTQPLADRTNLRHALLGLSRKMDVTKDVLWLFITSHGAHNKGAAISFYPFPFDADLSPATLKKQLDEAGIKWRIIVVSACYSGYYVPTLSDENTIVVTAASAENTSFGCDDKEEFTYFGEALFKKSFDATSPLEDIFKRAIKEVEAREINEKIDQPSQPQLFIGDKIKHKLEEFN